MACCFIQLDLFAVHHKVLPGEVLHRRLGGPFIQYGAGLLLQIAHERRIAFTGNNGQGIDDLHVFAAYVLVHTFALLINAQAKTAPHLLALLRGAVAAVLQGANLKYIGIVPAFPKGGMGENEPCRLVKGEQPLLVFQNQIIGGNIVGKLAATFGLAVDGMAGFLINAEIAPVRAFRRNPV